MSTWKPITEQDFKSLFDEQYEALDERQRQAFEQCAVPWWQATLRRSEEYGDEKVYVVAQKDDGILYFDDVEYGFNIATIDDDKKIIQPGGAQYTLREAIERWFKV